MSTIQFQIVIPVCNAADVIDQTVQSIWQQQFDREKIYIILVDFGSTDGTYQKMLSYDSFHLGIYQVNKDVSESCRASEAGRLASYTNPGGDSCCQILLWPGDVLYANSLARVAQVMEWHRCTGVLLSETDIKSKDGSIVRLPTLYESERVINGKTEYMEYLSRGYQHNILSFGGKIFCGNCYINGQMKERVWWNKSFFANFEQDVIYIPDYLGCIQERYYKDELQEILLRWDHILRFRRFDEDRHKRKLWENEQPERAIVHYVLWRSWLLEKNGDMRQAEECFRFSTVLFPGIRETQIYRWLEQYVLERDHSICPHIQAYFQNSK